MTTDNFNEVKDLFKEYLNIIPDEIKQNIKCEHIDTREKINHVFWCLRQQIGMKYYLEDKEGFALYYILVRLLELMLTNITQEAKDIMEYDKTNKKIIVHNEHILNEFKNINIPIIVFINNKEMVLNYWNDLNYNNNSRLKLSTVNDLTLDNKVENDQIILNVTYNGVTKPITFKVDNGISSNLYGDDMIRELSVPITPFNENNITIDNLILLIQTQSNVYDSIFSSQECQCFPPQQTNEKLKN